MFFGCWSKVIGGILRTSDRPSRNIDRVISGYLRSGVSQSPSLKRGGGVGAYTRILPHRKRCIIVTEFLEIPKAFTTIAPFYQNAYASVNAKSFRTRLETLRLLSAASSGPKSQNNHPSTLTNTRIVLETTARRRKVKI